MTKEQKQALIHELESRRAIMRIDSDKLWEYDWFADEAYRIALAALTQPASKALKLPEELPPRFYPVIMGGKTAMLPADDGEWLNRTTVVEYIDEVKRLNAPHTAPIEPICATGGAEWVKLTPEQAKKIYRDLDACQKVIHYARGFDPSYVTDAQDCLKIIDDALAAAPEVN